MKRRLHLIPFTITVPPERRDKHLQQKLLAERDGILAWAVQGCLDWQRHGRLDPPASGWCRPPRSISKPRTRWAAGSMSAACASQRQVADRRTVHRLEAVGRARGRVRRLAAALLRSADHRGFEKWRNSVGVRGFQGIGLKDPPKPAYTPTPTTDLMTTTASDASDALS
jgi:putative DNA primase/helicase